MQPAGSSEEAKGQESSAPTAALAEDGDGAEDEDALLQAALALSMGDSQGGGDEVRDESTVVRVSASKLLHLALLLIVQSGDADAEDGGVDGDDEVALRVALQLSMAEAEQGGEEGAALDANFVSQLLGSVGVDRNDPLMQAALEQLGTRSPSSGDAKRSNPNIDDGGSEDGGDSKRRRGEGEDPS